MKYKYRLYIDKKFIEGHSSLKEMEKAITKAKNNSDNGGKTLFVRNTIGQNIYILYIVKERKTRCVSLAENIKENSEAIEKPKKVAKLIKQVDTALQKLKKIY
jgi:hypothetical protein